MNGVAVIFQTIYTILSPFLAIAVMALGYWGVAVLQRHGYQATYAAAIVRAMGAGVAAAQGKGLDPFVGEGRSLVLTVGANYLSNTVGDAAKALGIQPGDHLDRVEAQLGVVAAQAEAVAQAATIATGFKPAYVRAGS